MSQDTLLSVRVFPGRRIRAALSAMNQSARRSSKANINSEPWAGTSVLVGATQGLSNRIGVFLNLRETCSTIACSDSRPPCTDIVLEI
jgi:hypothetical protein